MNSKENLRKVEKYVLITYATLWLLVYLLSRIFLELYTDYTPSGFLLWTALFIAPFSIYASFRTVFPKGEKWYSFIGYVLIYSLLATFTSQYIVVNGDILWSAATKPAAPSRKATVLEVRKVFHSKTGFDHTEVSLQIDGKLLNLEARPYAYFYLKDKKTLLISLRKSGLGIDYVTSTGVNGGERRYARWLHFKDWVYRMRWGLAIVLGIITMVWIRMEFFPEKEGSKPVRIGYWKLIGIIFATLLLLYAGLLLYVNFFSAHRP